jgi:hypothetical protein
VDANVTECADYREVNTSDVQIEENFKIMVKGVQIENQKNI